MDKALSKVALFRDRFIHRDDVFARQWINEKGMGYYRVTEGECHFGCSKKACIHVTDKPMTREDILDHLKGTETLATYQLADDNTVRWLCLDVDGIKGKDTPLEVVQAHTRALVQVVEATFGANSCLVEFSGNKGYHIWILFFEPVQARHAFVVASWLDLQVKHPEGVHVDVFPRQTAIKSYGNMVKLPLGIHKVTGNRCFFVNAVYDSYGDQWQVLTNVFRFNEKKLLDIIKSKNIDIVPAIRVDKHVDSPGTGSLPCVSRMMREGLQQGCRDTGSLYIATWMKRRNIPINVALAAMEEINESTSPPLDLDILSEKVYSAYEHDYSEFPCANSALDGYCSSSCFFWNTKERDRWSRFGKQGSAVGVISRD